VFTEEFIEHCKTRENEMRVVRKEITELEQQNSVLHKHIEIMKQSSAKLDTDLERYQNTNNQLKNKMDTFRYLIIDVLEILKWSFIKKRILTNPSKANDHKLQYSVAEYNGAANAE